MLRHAVSFATLGVGVGLVLYAWGPLVSQGDRFWLMEAVIFGWFIRSSPWLLEERREKAATVVKYTVR